MVDYPLAILKFTWSDTPWVNGQPSGVPYSDALINRLYLPLEQEWGVAGFWRRATFDLLNLEGSEVFPWRKLMGLSGAVAHDDRRVVIANAITVAKAEGWPLERFKGIVVLVAPRNPLIDAGAWGESCLVQVGDSNEFCTHEMGHALGFEHTLGPNRGSVPPVLGSYNDEYCVMGDGFYTMPPQPGGPSPGDGYWTSGPFVSAASLCAFLPGFVNDAQHVGHAGKLTPGFWRTLRVRARDLRRSGDTPYPIALVVDVPGGGLAGGVIGAGMPPSPSRWVVELRRSRSWDQGLGGSASPIGLVVHSLRPLDEFNDGKPDFRTRAVYEGVLPLRNSMLLPNGRIAGDADACFGDGVFSIRVDAVADDLAWAEVTVGGALLGRDANVSVDFGLLNGREDAHLESGRAENVHVFICSTGDYDYTLSHRACRRRSVVTSFGYDSPALSWKINGTSIPSDLGTVANLRVPVIAHYPLPAGGESNVPRTAKVRYQVEPSALVLIGDPTDGNYTLDIEVTANEADPHAPSPAAPSTANGVVKMVGQVLTYEDAYYEALEACIKHLQELDHRFSKSVRPGLRRIFRSSDPLNVKLAVLNRVRLAASAEGNFALAEQLGQVTLQLGARKLR